MLKARLSNHDPNQNYRAIAGRTRTQRSKAQAQISQPACKACREGLADRREAADSFIEAIGTRRFV